jgi:hypothetical protein
MCSQKTGRACGTWGRRELRQGAVPQERTARLQADGFGTIDIPIAGAERGTGQRTANAIEGVGGAANALRISALDGESWYRREYRSITSGCTGCMAKQD